jgi:predicted molibdopterin-dependent oxidoreductase YjgC
MQSIAEKDFGTPQRLSAKLVTLTIDGREVTVPEGTSVMRAAALSEVKIPKLCATDQLEAFGGYPMNHAHPSEIMDEIARLTPTFTGVSYARIDELGSIQWPCNPLSADPDHRAHLEPVQRGRADAPHRK